MNKFFVELKEVFLSQSPDWRGLVMLRCPSSGTNCALDSLSLWRPRRPQLRWRRLHGESSHENGLTFLLSNTFSTQIRKHFSLQQYVRTCYLFFIKNSIQIRTNNTLQSTIISYGRLGKTLDSRALCLLSNYIAAQLFRQFLTAHSDSQIREVLSIIYKLVTSTDYATLRSL